jgi:cytosine/adenosine deaminase-related metal-dependent hydrolase
MIGHPRQKFPLRWMLDAGVDVVLGSDAPVSPLDPWLAVAAAVHRSGDEREPWHPEQAITAREALAASTDGWGTVAVGHPADLVLLDADPLDGTSDRAHAGALRGFAELADRKCGWWKRERLDLRERSEQPTAGRRRRRRPGRRGRQRLSRWR